MRTLQRIHDDDSGDPQGNAGGNLDSLHSAGQRFAAAAESAIDNALSHDSTQFLQSCVQEGGQ